MNSEARSLADFIAKVELKKIFRWLSNTSIQVYSHIFFTFFFVSEKCHENKVNQLTFFWMVCFLIKEVQNAARSEHFRNIYLEVIALVTCRVRKCQWSIPELSRLSVSKDFDSPPQRTVSLTITIA